MYKNSVAVPGAYMNTHCHHVDKCVYVQGVLYTGQNSELCLNAHGCLPGTLQYMQNVPNNEYLGQ